MVAERVWHWQSLSWNGLLCPCSLHSLNQHLFSQQLQPWHRDPYQSLPTSYSMILWSSMPYPLPSGLTCPMVAGQLSSFQDILHDSPRFENECINESAIPKPPNETIQHQLFKTLQSKNKPRKYCVDFFQITSHLNGLCFVIIPPSAEKAIS